MTRLLLDQGITRSTAKLISSYGWDTVHVGDIGMSLATDAEIIEKGLGGQRVIVTLDSDFHTQLAVTGAQFPSTIRDSLSLDSQRMSNCFQYKIQSAKPAETVY